MTKDTSKISNTYIPPICVSLKSISFRNSGYLKNKLTTATRLTDTFFHSHQANMSACIFFHLLLFTFYYLFKNV